MPAKTKLRGYGADLLDVDTGLSEIAANSTASSGSAIPGGGHRTAQRAVELLSANPAYHCPTREQRKVMLAAYARRGMVLHSAAFDIVRMDRWIDLSDADAVADNIDAIIICEIKATNQAKIGPDLKGYFFNITGGEQLTAQSLGDRYRFLFVNTVTGHTQELRLNEVFGRARAMYTAWHIKL